MRAGCARSLAVGFVLVTMVLGLGPFGPVHTPRAAPLSGSSGHLAPPVAPHRIDSVGSRPLPPRGALARGETPASTKFFSYEWLEASIFYGPTDPATRLFGVGNTVASDAPLDNTTMFGGLASGGLSNITLSYDNGTSYGGGGQWVYAGLSPTPSARANNSLATYTPGGFEVLFGGLTNTRTQAVSNETWVFDVANQSWRNATRAVAPPARENGAFAVDQKDGFALLEGGIDPDYQIGSVTGTVIWNDTWKLNLTTLSWSRLTTIHTLPALYGSSMIWSPANDEFLLNGGCATTSCSNVTWAYSPSTGDWRPLVVTGTVPSARASSSYVWDPVDNVSILFGGFRLGGGG